jgi:hypothetical protein
MKPRLSPRPAVIAAIALPVLRRGQARTEPEASIHPSATSVWPPTGIALAAFLVLGLRIWPAIFLGAFLVNVTTAGSVVSSIGIAIGNPRRVVGAALVNRFANGRRAPRSRRGCLLSSRCSRGFLPRRSAHRRDRQLSPRGGFADWKDYNSIWITWWLGRRTGALIFAPVLMLWSLKPRQTRDLESLQESSGRNPGRLLVLSHRSYSCFPFLCEQNYPLEFLLHSVPSLGCLPVSTREAATAVLLLSGIAIWGTPARRPGRFGAKRSTNRSFSCRLS